VSLQQVLPDRLAPGCSLSDPDHRVVVVVLTEPASRGRLRYDGAELVASSPAPCSASAYRRAGALQTGRRYRDDHSGFEVRCAQGGPGRLTFDGRPMTLVRANR
jgi:hypothetical protein